MAKNSRQIATEQKSKTIPDSPDFEKFSPASNSYETIMETAFREMRF